MNINTSTSIIESVLKTAKMPSKGSVGQRILSAKNAEEGFYTMLQSESEDGEIHVGRLIQVFRKVFPGVDVKMMKVEGFDTLGGVTARLSDKGQVKGYDYLLGSISDKGTVKLDGNSIETIQHEVSHLSKSVFCPKFQSSIYGFYRAAIKKFAIEGKLAPIDEKKINLRNSSYENIYQKFLYNCELNDGEFSVFKERFNEGGKARLDAVKERIEDVKNNYRARINFFAPLVEDEKITVIKQNLRRLESEQKAHLAGFKYRAKHQKIQEETPEFAEMKDYLVNYKGADVQRKENIKENYVEYLFPEKIKMLKELFFEEVQKSRAAHRQRLNQGK